jgi:hypothetical protein
VRVVSSPKKRTVPLSAVSRPAMMRSSVVLPDPDGPSSATSSPVPTSSVTFRSAANEPNVLLMSSI